MKKTFIICVDKFFVDIDNFHWNFDISLKSYKIRMLWNLIRSSSVGTKVDNLELAIHFWPLFISLQYDND